MESLSSGNPRYNLESHTESIEKVIHVNGFQRTISSSENPDAQNNNCDSLRPNNLTYTSLRFAVESSIGKECSWDGNKKRNGDADFNGFLDHTKDDSQSLKCALHLEQDENLLKAVSLDHDSDGGSKRDDTKDLCSDDSPDDGCSEARFKGSSSASLQPKAAIFQFSLGSKPMQSSFCARIDELVDDSHDGYSESRFKASGSIDSLPASFAANGHIPDNDDRYNLKLKGSDAVLTEAASVVSSEPQPSSRPILPVSCRLLSDLTEPSFQRRFTVIAEPRSCEDISESRFKASHPVTSLQITVATNDHIVDISDGRDRGVSDPRLAEPNHNSPDLLSANTQADLNHAEPLCLGVPESPRPSQELLVETSVQYRKRKFQYSKLGNDANGKTGIHRKRALENRNRLSGLAAETVTINPVAETIQEPNPEEFPDAGCRILTEHSYQRRFTVTAQPRSCNDISESRFKASHPVTSLQTTVATNDQIVDISDGHVMDVSDPRLAEPNYNSPDSISANTEADLYHAEPLGLDVLESPSPSLLVKTSAQYMKRKLQYSNLGNDANDQTVIHRKTALENRNRISGLAAETATINPVPETIQEPDPEEFPDAGCRIPFNGHGEDINHFRLCDIVAAGICLREEHASWLRNIPSDSTRVVNLVMGRSCRRTLLNGTCTEVGCAFKHPIDLNLDFPSTQLKTIINSFTKWFVENAPNPGFKGIWLMLSRLPKDHDDVLMIVFSFAKMIPRLKKVYRQALAIKLVEILVNVMNFKPWEAVRTLLVFSVTQITTQDEIEDLVCKQRLKNRLFESVSCLWHVSETFVCPADILFKLIKECLVKMPKDLKLTKDKIVADLMKLPRRTVLKEFLLIDKFLGTFYPQNSDITHAVRSRVLYQQDLTSVRAVSYESSRIKGTGPVNPKWKYWDIAEARTKSFELVLRNNRSKLADESTFAEEATRELVFENLQDDVTCEDLFKILSKKNVLSSKAVPDDNTEPLVESLRAGNYGELVRILASSCEPDGKVMRLRALQRELELCEKSKLPAVVFEILEKLQEEPFQGTSAGGDFTCLLNSLVLRFYRDSDFKSAIKLIKTMRMADVNHMEYVPKDVDPETFSLICSEIHLECCLYSEAIRCLTYNDCFNFVKYDKDSVHFLLLDRVVTNMFKTFLKNRLASHALDIFRVVLLAQKHLHFPLDIGRFYEGTLFLSFVRDLKKNAGEVGDGANLYILVDRICGNDEKFHSITYRSLLVELQLVHSPEDVLRRTLLLCLKSGAYPDFSSGRFHPLVLNSLLTTDEMAIYLKHYFKFFVAQRVRLDDRPFIVRFIECYPLNKPFPVSNDVMKTPGSVPEALDRLKSALQKVSGSSYRELDAEFSADCLTIPIHGVRALLGEFS